MSANPKHRKKASFKLEEFNADPLAPNLPPNHQQVEKDRLDKRQVLLSSLIVIVPLQEFYVT